MRAAVVPKINGTWEVKEVPTPKPNQGIPAWIKNNAKWWAEDMVFL